MKRIIAFILAIMLLAICCACGRDKANKNNAEKKNNTSSHGSDDTSSGDGDEVDPADDQSLTPGSVSLEDGTVTETYITVDDDNSIAEILPEYGTAPATLNTKWNADCTRKSGYSDAQANALREKVLGSGNTASIYKITGTTYYVSPRGNDDNDGKSPQRAFKTTKASVFSRNILKPGDAVLFERGGLWRLTNPVKCKEGVIYGSYGEGEKPTFYGSAYNYANSEFWVPSTRENIWKVTVADIDVGLIVFNHGEMVGAKKLNGLIALEKNGDFYFNRNQDTVYLYYDGGNPGKVFKDIEIGLKKSAFTASNAPDITIDNIRIKYIGAFGISVCGCDNFTVTNCEVGFIGGAIQSGTLRYGNGIQVWNGVDGHRIENCWIYQVYDAAVTFQGDYTYSAARMSDEYKNITYKGNLFEYSTYSVEFWHANSGDKTKGISDAVIKNFQCVDNISRFAGYGFGRQRTDHAGYHICVFSHTFPNAESNAIKNNIFDCSDSYIVRWNFSTDSNYGEWDISGNTYFHGKNRFGDAIWYGGMRNASNLSTLEAAVRLFDSNPKSIKWIG